MTSANVRERLHDVWHVNTTYRTAREWISSYKDMNVHSIGLSNDGLPKLFFVLNMVHEPMTRSMSQLKLPDWPMLRFRVLPFRICFSNLVIDSYFLLIVVLPCITNMGPPDLGSFLAF